MRLRITRRINSSRTLARTKSTTRGRTNLNNPSKGEKKNEILPISRGESKKDFTASITLFFSASAYPPIKGFSSLCGHLRRYTRASGFPQNLRRGSFFVGENICAFEGWPVAGIHFYTGIPSGIISGWQKWQLWEREESERTILASIQRRYTIG